MTSRCQGDGVHIHFSVIRAVLYLAITVRLRRAKRVRVCTSLYVAFDARGIASLFQEMLPFYNKFLSDPHACSCMHKVGNFRIVDRIVYIYIYI